MSFGSRRGIEADEYISSRLKPDISPTYHGFVDQGIESIKSRRLLPLVLAVFSPVLLSPSLHSLQSHFLIHHAEIWQNEVEEHVL